MKYLFTDISTHIDLGFGITATNFRRTAIFLDENYKGGFNSGEMPVLYLFRHSVELYIKSLITIFHKELRLPYKDGELAFDNDIPYIKVKKEWKEISKCHDISTLYKYFMEILEENRESLALKAPDANWDIIKPENQIYVDMIKSYDFDSTYFRYPFTKNKNADKKKYNVEMIDIEEVTKKLNPNKQEVAFLIFNDDEELVEAHISKKTELDDLIDAIKELSSYFNNIHAMTRATLCDSW
ncbi:hypothetical protein [Bacillus sp. RS11]|uniref:hypothetical protein n=1 Tax=Lysinibacillus sp. RS11 TaxID=3242682 RepID=UPI0035C681C2